MAQYFFNPRSTYVTNTGQVASLGRLAFYESGTQTLKAVYAQDGVTAIANPVVLDAGGRAPEIKLGNGDYKVILESYVGIDQASQPIYTPVWTIDPYNGEAVASGGSGNVVIVNNIADLRLIDITAFTTAYVIGYYVPGDLGQGWFNFDSTATGNDDQGSIIVPSGGGGVGRWLRLFEDDVIYPQMWGAMDNIVGATVSSRLIAMFDFADASELQKTVIFPEQDYPIGGSISFTGVNTEVIFKRGAKVTRAVVTPTTLTINVKSLEIPINNAGIVGSEVTLNITTSDISDIPLSSWNGANDIQTFEKASGNYNGRLLIDRAYVITAASITTSVSDAHFLPTGSISTPATYTGKLTLNRFTYEDNLTNLFIDDQSKILFENVKTFQAQHFIPSASNIQDFEYAMLINSVTLNGGRNAAIIWDFYSNYTFTDAVPTATDYKLEMLVGDQSTITFNFDVYFGTVVNQPGRKIFINAGGSPILNQVIYPQWFGVLGGIATATQTANVTNMTAAFSCADVSSPSVIDGNNIAIYLNNPIVMPFAADSIKLRNMDITIDATFAGAEVISAQSELRLEDVRFFLALKPATNMVKILGGGEMYANRITVENGGSVYNRVVGRVREIKDSIITNMATMQIWCDTTQINITGNKFTNTELYFDDPGYIRVTGNEFLTTDGSPSNAICYLISPGNGAYPDGTWISTNVVISDNTFINQTASTLINVSTHNVGISPGGNGPCSVINNSCIGLYTIRSTEITYEHNWVNITSGTTYSSTFNANLILHSNPNDYFIKNALHIEPVSFSWVIRGSNITGTLLTADITYWFLGGTTTPANYYRLVTTGSAQSSWSGDVSTLIRTESNNLSTSTTITTTIV